MSAIRVGVFLVTMFIAAQVFAAEQTKYKSFYYLRRADQRLVEFDPETNSDVTSISVPKLVFDRNARTKIHINSTGKILIWSASEPKNVYFFNGKTLETVITDYDRIADVDFWSSGPLLAADGSSIFYSKNDSVMTYLPDKPGTPKKANEFRIPSTVKTTFMLFQKSLTPDKRNGAPLLIDKKEFSSCECSTAACVETCPVGVIRAPKEVVSDSFIVEQFVEGQLESRSEGFFRLANLKGKWVATDIPSEAANSFGHKYSGGLTISTDGGGGCCGWENQSNQTTWLHKGADRTELYDEYKEHHNADYDVFFANSSSVISPNHKWLALEFREYHNDCETPEECAASKKVDPNISVRRTTTDQPKQTPDKIIKEIPKFPMTRFLALKGIAISDKVEFEKSTFVGWLNDDCALIFINDKLNIFDVSSKRATLLSPITREGEVFLPAQ